MSLEEYIKTNYANEFKKSIPIALNYLLKSYYAADVPLDEFKKHFFLDRADFNEILSFILEDNNAYELAKFGSRYYENNQYNFKNDRKKTASDDYGYDDSEKFIKRFH